MCHVIWQIQPVILANVDQRDQLFITTLIEHTKTFKSNGKEKLSDFEVNRDKECYILTAFLEEGETGLHLEELESIKAARFEQDQLSIMSVSLVFQDSKSCLRILILCNNPSSTSCTTQEVHSSGSQSTIIYQDLFNLKQSVQSEFATFLKDHESVDAKVYNEDERYKTLTKEAIEAKSFAMKKIDIFIQARTSQPVNNGLLERIKNTQLSEYAKEYIALELKSCVFDFPWKDILDNKETINFQNWSPEILQPWQLDIIRPVVTKNSNCVKVLLRGIHFIFPNGVFAQDTIKLVEPLLPECAATMAFLLSMNTRLTCLDVR